MSQWKNTDDAANSVIWAAQQVKLTANTSNQTDLFGNTTADAFITDATIGQYGIDTAEMRAARAGSLARPAHAGWVLRTEGSGGRAGRVSYETLVAMSTMSGDSSDVTLPDYAIVISSQPANATANTTDSEEAEFTVVAASVPTGATLTYAWTYANGDAIQAGANVGNTDEATLTVNSAVETANVSFKVEISTTGATNVVSTNATLTITT
jgi:hypothetical protein